jgi:hypothetical protein
MTGVMESIKIDEKKQIMMVNIITIISLKEKPSMIPYSPKIEVRSSVYISMSFLESYS